MSRITYNLLSQYYGFDRELDSAKFISSHEAVINVDLSNEYQVIDCPTEDTDNGEIAEEPEVQKEEEEVEEEEEEEIPLVRNASGNGSAKSLHVLDEDNLPKDKTRRNDYENYLASKSVSNDYAFKANKHSDISKDRSIGHNVESMDSKVPGPTDEESFANPGRAVEEISSDDASYSLTLERKKKGDEKVNVCVGSLTPAPKKSLHCNGVYLDLAHSEIHVFPIDALQEFSGLKMLYLENNRLTELPAELFSSLRELRWLDVRRNLLTTIPASVKGHPCLETILLQGNKVEKLPLELCLVRNLKRLQTVGNRLTFPPEDIVASGCTGIVNFLRNKWNELHPEEIVRPTETYGDIGPKASVIPRYRPKRLTPGKLTKTSSSLTKSGAISSPTAIACQTRTWSTRRRKSCSYKPNSRCESKGTDITMEQRLAWISKAKEILGKQTLALQRIRDKETLKEWRQDKRSFNTSLKKAAGRTEEDIPFAVDSSNLPPMLRREKKVELVRKSRREKCRSILASNMDEQIGESMKTLNQLEVAARASGALTPRSEQKLLQDEIKKISDLQVQIENLKRLNETVVRASLEEPYESSVSSKEYKFPPPIII